MKFDIDILSGSVDTFLECFNNRLQNEFKALNTRSIPIDDYWQTIIHTTINSPKSKNIELIWQINLYPSNSLKHIEVFALNTETNCDWVNVVKTIINDAIAKTMNPSVTIPTCHLFGYIGPILDGEYNLQDFRLTPGPHQNRLLGGMPDNVEQVICLYLETTAETVPLAQEKARLKAKKYASMLSLFLGIGLYEVGSYDITHNIQYLRHASQYR